MKKKLSLIFLFFLILSILFIYFLFPSCYRKNNNQEIPEAVNGVLDLKDWDFKEQGSILLNGQWKFKFMEDSPEFILPEFNDEDWETLNVPGDWKKKKGAKTGYGWLRLTIKNLDLKSPGIYLECSSSAYTMYVNGEKTAQNGKAGETKDNTVPQLLPRIVPLPAADEIVIAWKISNFHDVIGGPVYEPRFGEYHTILTNTMLRSISNTFMMGIIFIIAVYHFLLWFKRRNDKSTLYFSLFCMVIFLRTLCIYHYISILFQEAHLFELQSKINFISIPLGWYTFSIFFYELFQKNIRKSTIKIITLITIAFVVLGLITPRTIYGNLLTFSQITLIIICFWIFNTMVKVYIKQRDDTLFLLLGFLFIFLGVISDTIMFHFFYHAVRVIQVCLVCFIFFQSVFLSYRSARAHRTADYLSKNLQDEVNKQTLKINKQKEHIQKINRERTDFFINFAHETKTPLTIITNLLEKYRRKKGDDRDLESIRQNVDVLSRNITNFLDIEKLEKGMVAYNNETVIELSKFINDKINLFRHIAGKRGINIEYEYDRDIYINIDPFALDRILNNLIDNAIKYNMENGKIIIHSETGHDAVKFVIANTGPGITREQQEHVFDPYYQISHEKKNIQGMGMGLNIVKKIIRDMGAEIKVDSEPGIETRFIIIFHQCFSKIKKTDPADFQYSKPISSYNSRKLQETDFQKEKNTILIVEDNLDMLGYLQDSLQDLYNVFLAENGEEALSKMSKIPRPHIIISDIMMDKMDGYGFHDKLTEMKEFSSIPFIFLTARTTPDEKLNALKKGAVDFITKPFNIDELNAKICSLISVQKSQRAFSTSLIEQKIMNAIRNPENERNNNYINLEKKFNDYKITSREKEIIHLLFDGKEAKEIGYELNIAITTVRKHIRHIYEKCQIQNRVELINFFKYQ